MIDEKIISELSPDKLFGSEIFDEIYDIEDEIDRTRYLAALSQRAKQLNCEREMDKVVKAYEKKRKQLDNEYERSQKKDKVKIPVEMDEKGHIKTTIGNFESILRGDEHFKNIRYNLLTYLPERVGSNESWTDADDAEIRSYIESVYKIHSSAKCDDAFRIFAKSREYHPIRQIIDALKWDGESRICNFLHYATGCEDNAYTREVSRLIFAGGIHRIYRPGCKFDNVPVLIGTKQGEGKSTLIRWIAMKDEFYTSLETIEGQKGMEAIEGVWICEIEEMAGAVRAKEVETVKAFITRQSDHYRKPYDRRVSNYNRQCIFVGTTNKAQFLTDKTGNRRFFPVLVNQSGYDLYRRETEVKEYIKQCWAEAKHLYDTNNLPPFADERLIDIIREKQSMAVEDDYRVGMIQSFLKTKSRVCVLQLWRYALGNGELIKPTSKERGEISLIMQSIPGWERSNKTMWFGNEIGSQKGWMRIGSDTTDSNDFRDIN